MSNDQKITRNTRQSPSVGDWLRRVGRGIVHNWPWKLGCLVLSVCLWAGVIAQDDTLRRPKTFSDVTIAVRNSDTLQRNGFIVVSGLEQEHLSGLSMRADVPQKAFQSAAASNYDPRVDLSRIRSAGTQQVAVVTTNSAQYGTVTDLSVTSLEVQVEEYITRSMIPVSRVETFGSLPDNFYYREPSTDPSYVSIAGPRSLVNAVVRCVPQFDLSAVIPFFGTERTAVPFILVDASGNEVAQTQIRVSPLNSGIIIDTVTVSLDMFEYLTLPVNTETAVTGEPADGYYVKNVTPSHAQVKAALQTAGSDPVWQDIQVSDPVDLTGLTQTQTFHVHLLKPEKCEHLSTEDILLTVEIAPEQTQKDTLEDDV